MTTADEFKHEVGRYLESQTEKLFVRQREPAAEAPYYRRTGRLKNALWNLPSASGTKIEITYPLHIRFLDMKKGRKGKKKKRYAPIYNKYVCGYLKADVHRTLNRLVPKIMINAIEDTFGGTKTLNHMSKLERDVRKAANTVFKYTAIGAAIGLILGFFFLMVVLSM